MGFLNKRRMSPRKPTPGLPWGVFQRHWLLSPRGPIYPPHPPIRRNFFLIKHLGHGGCGGGYRKSPSTTSTKSVPVFLDVSPKPRRCRRGLPEPARQVSGTTAAEAVATTSSPVSSRPPRTRRSEAVRPEPAGPGRPHYSSTGRPGRFQRGNFWFWTAPRSFATGPGTTGHSLGREPPGRHRRRGICP